MDSEPMFCFETSLKMLYFSMLIYRHGEVSSACSTIVSEHTVIKC